MPAYLFPPGCIDHYVRFRSGVTSYLGTAVTAPETEGEIGLDPVMNDLAGRRFPLAFVNDGQMERVYTTLNRFDYVVYQQLRDASRTASQVGYEPLVERGTLATGVNDFELILVNSFAGTTGTGTPTTLPAGRRYFSAMLEGFKESTAGSRVTEVALAFTCIGLFDPTTRSFSVYTETNLGSLPAPS